MNFLNYTIRRAAAGEVIKQSRQLRKGGCLSALSKIFFILLTIFLIVAGIIYISSRPNETASTWDRVSPGDSLYTRNTNGVSFYRKGRVKLNDSQIAQLKYTRRDTLSFVRKNSINEESFYKFKNTFIGICTGKDSSVTKEGESSSNRWLQVIPNSRFITNTDWDRSKKDILSTGTLSNEWYIMASDVSLFNNDSLLLITATK